MGRTQTLRAFVTILSLAIASSALAHSDTKWTKGPYGGHMVDAGKQHWELVARGSALTLYVMDEDEKPLATDGGTAKAQVLVAGKISNVEFKNAGGNMWRATGEFTAAKGMRVIVMTNKLDGQSFQARRQLRPFSGSGTDGEQTLPAPLPCFPSTPTCGPASTLQLTSNPVTKATSAPAFQKCRGGPGPRRRTPAIDAGAVPLAGGGGELQRHKATEGAGDHLRIAGLYPFLADPCHPASLTLYAAEEIGDRPKINRNGFARDQSALLGITRCTHLELGLRFRALERGGPEVGRSALSDALNVIDYLGHAAVLELFDKRAEVQ